VDTGRHAGRTRVDFSGPRPVTVEAEPPVAAAVAPGVPPAGAVDPVTLILSVLSAPAGAPLCDLSADVFDGLRTTRAALGPPRAEGAQVRCDGTYTRVAGFSPDEMAERRQFHFTLTYAVAPDGAARLEGVELDTLYGKGRLKRR
jgi:hypothetical protein